MKKSILSVIFFLFTGTCFGQQFVPIWNNNMPNSKGVIVRDSIANERIYQVGNPGVYVFECSEAERKRGAVLIIPGGGYARLAYQISGFQLAKWFNTIGMTAFVLSHRLPQSPDVEVSYKAPLEDAQRAMRFIRTNSRQYNIDPDKVGVMGSSAGAHLAACLSTFDEDWGIGKDELDHSPFRPDFAILVSPVISMGELAHKGSRNNLLGESASQELIDMFSCDKRVTTATPPAIMVHAGNDKSVSPINSVLYYTALKNKRIDKSSLHIFPEGGHSISLRDNPGSTNYWTTLAEEWLHETGFLVH